MKKLLISKIIIIVIVATILMTAAVLFTLNIHNRQIARDNISLIIKMLENIIVNENIDILDDYRQFVRIKNINNNIRISIISLEGDILADTFRSDIENNTFDNQSTKDEILKLQETTTEIVYSVRYSNFFAKHFIYGAKIINIGENTFILRVAIPLDYINRYMAGFAITIIALMTLLLIIFLFLFLPRFVSVILRQFKTIRNNLNNILENDFSNTKNITKYDEINTILEEINIVADKLCLKNTENENEKHKLKYVLDNINQGLVALDKNMHIVFINSFALTLLNIADSGAKFLIEVIRDNATVLEIENAIKERRYISFEYSPLSLILQIEVIPVDEGLHSLIKISDITEIKNFDIQKSDLFINASHKLNTPLTSILGYSDMILLSEGNTNNSSDKSSIYNFTHRINDEAKKMKSLISDMLELTKYEKDRQLGKDVYKESIDMHAMTKEIIDEMAIIAKNKNISINFDAEDDLFIFANKDDIKEALSNLLDNAIKYNKQNGTIDISIKCLTNKIIFIISDSGIGIASKYINRIFERFFRIDDKNTKSIEGTGIGLSIVKHVCINSNANISVHSLENVGTDITIEFKKYRL